MTGPTLRLALALLLAVALPRRRARGGRGRRRRGRPTLVVIPLNLPAKRGLKGPDAQARWVARRMRRADFATIAECHPELARAIDRMPDLRCEMAPPNYGGAGNAVVVNTRRVDRPRFSSWPFAYTALYGMRTTLHAARVEATKDGATVALDAIHAASRPSRDRYKTEASDAVRADYFRTMARNEPRDCDLHLFAGDINWRVDQVMDVLPKGWRHLGGAGVEQVFGRGATKRGRLTRAGQRVLRYLGVSDHHVTAKVKIGARR